MHRRSDSTTLSHLAFPRECGTGQAGRCETLHSDSQRDCSDLSTETSNRHLWPAVCLQYLSATREANVGELRVCEYPSQSIDNNNNNNQTKQKKQTKNQPRKSLSCTLKFNRSLTSGHREITCSCDCLTVWGGGIIDWSIY